MLKQTDNRVTSSFRDPSGFVYYRDGVLHRQVNLVYKNNYDKMINSGLYKRLVESDLLVSHEVVDCPPHQPACAYRIIRPRMISFISYPYEWCFSQLKDAALATLSIMKQAMEYGMILKDASAYNIQFVNCRPMLIDTLSFDYYVEGKPWVAYKQFCQHFLAPLVLMAYCDIRLGQLLRIHLDGIPLDLTSSLLPWRTWRSFSLLTNIHLHAKSQRHYASKPAKSTSQVMNRKALLGLIDNLESCINRLKWHPGKTTWIDYYESTNYDTTALEHKKSLVSKFLDDTHAAKVWDLGANTGMFSQIAAQKGIDTISFDYDFAAVEKNYLDCHKKGITRILPLVLDLTNPSPGIGWEHRERTSLLDRAPSDTVMALALIHHLAIGNNVPLERIGLFFQSICRSLIIEFIPKEDSQVERLLVSREDVFPTYTRVDFERIFSNFFVIEKAIDIDNSKRTLYLMQRR